MTSEDPGRPHRRKSSPRSETRSLLEDGYIALRATFRLAVERLPTEDPAQRPLTFGEPVQELPDTAEWIRRVALVRSIMDALGGEVDRPGTADGAPARAPRAPRRPVPFE